MRELSDAQFLKACAMLAQRLAKENRGKAAQACSGFEAARHQGIAEAYENVRRWIMPTEVEKADAERECAKLVNDVLGAG